MNSSRSTSSSSSGSSTSSGSSSCTDSGSSSSDSETSTSSDGKPLNTTRGNDSKTKSQVVTRRKSSECKATQQKFNAADSDKATTKVNPTNGTTSAAAAAASQKPTKHPFAYSSEDESPPAKKPLKRLTTPNTMQTGQRRKPPGPFALTASKLQKPQTEATTAAASATTTATTAEVKTNKAIEENNKKEDEKPSAASTNADIIEKTAQVTPVKKPTKQETNTKVTPKLSIANTTPPSQPPPAKGKQPPAKRASGALPPGVPTRASTAAAASSTTKKKGSEESELESVSGSEDESSSSSSETESSENSSYTSKVTKGIVSGGPGGIGLGAKRRNKDRHTGSASKNPKNDLTDSEDGPSPSKEARNRKLTRSLSTRRLSKQQVKSSAGVSQTGAASDTDSEPVNGMVNDIKRSLSKSPAKKPFAGLSGGLSKCTVKKEISNNGFANVSRATTPPQLENRCPVDGCDSSGHLSGNMDCHFLPEACPIYHNMSVSECKDRANERKVRGGSDTRSKSTSNSNNIDAHPKSIPQTSSRHQQNHEQKEFYNKIKESRARFKPIAEVVNSDKLKLEKDCADDDREPSLLGIVPDYDLQLFRDAQALASEKIEDEVKELPIGKGIK